MEKHKLESFQLQVYKRVKKYSLGKSMPESERLKAVEQFYRENTVSLIRLLEKTLKKDPVVTCIFLIHQIDNIVNHHFGIERDVFSFGSVHRSVPA